MLCINYFSIFSLIFLTVTIAGRCYAINFVTNYASHEASRDSSLLGKDFIKSKNFLILADSIKFGINGHPLTQEAYLNSDLDFQIKLIKELNLSSYRVDLIIDNAGNVANDLRFKELINKTKNNNIEILPVLINTSWEKEAKEKDCYLLGQKIGEKFASKYKKYLKHYEIGNEDDSKLMDAKHDGSLIEHYSAVKFTNLISYYKGIIKGIRTVDEDAEIVISSSGWLHIGFFKILENEQIDYDILGYHWYSDMGDLTKDNFNILDSLAMFNKPIWFTEINRRNGSKEGAYTGNTFFEESESKDVAQFQWLKRYFEQLSTKNNVHAIYIYELYDQPAFDDGKGFEAPHEAYFGLARWTKRYSQFQRKSGYYQLKAKIEELHYGVRDYISMLYLDFNGIAPKSDEYNEALTELYRWQDFSLFVNNFAHNLILKRLIIDKYNNLLNREPLPAELNYWLKASSYNISKQVTLNITLSEEFWNLVGKTNESFVENLYLRLQKREADAPGKIYWINQLNLNSNKQTIVESILESEEYINKFIKKNYEHLISKEMDAVFLTKKLQNKKSSFSESKYIIDLVSSKDFWEKALRNGCEMRNGTFCNFY